MRRKKRNDNIRGIHVILFVVCLFLLPGLFVNGLFLLPLVVLAALIPTFIRNAKSGGTSSVPTRAVPGGNTKDCPNPEPHRHFSAAQGPLSRSEQDETARRKRLESMRVLYEAGILTREEFDHEVRRIKES